MKSRFVFIIILVKLRPVYFSICHWFSHRFFHIPLYNFRFFRNKKIICLKNEQSVSAPNVFAVGDVLDGGIELTPVAIQAGRLLMRRLFGTATNLVRNSGKNMLRQNVNYCFFQCDYINVPTTVFTPLEYGFCGYSEEEATKEFGEESIEVSHLVFWSNNGKMPAKFAFL